MDDDPVLDLPGASDLRHIAADLESITTRVAASPEVDAPDLRIFLGFINKVIQVAGQVFEDVYTILIDVSQLRPSDLDTDRLVDVRRSVALLMARSRYRDAEEICSRLHHLSEHFDGRVKPVVERTGADWDSWWSVLRLIEEHEGFLIMVVHRASYQFTDLLDGLTAESLPEVRAAAKNQASEIHTLIGRLTALRNRILGLSGTTGLIELVGVDDRKAALHSLAIGEMHVGDTYHVAGAGAVGRGAKARDVVINQQWQTFAAAQDLGELAQELARLRAELRIRANEPTHDFAVAEVAAAQVAAQDEDGSKVFAHLAKAGKWALDVATSIGTNVAAKAITASMGL